MKYLVITAGTSSILQSEVNRLIGNGWTPQGGASMMCVLPEGNTSTVNLFIQAVVKNEMPKKEQTAQECDATDPK